MARLSDETKLRQKRCQGEGADYVPWIRANEGSSTGTSYIVKNYKVGRFIHLLSTAEFKVFCVLLYADEVLDMKEQYVLDLAECKNIAGELGYRKPTSHMSTDFFLKIKDPVYNYMAISVKKNEFNISEREREKLEIEQVYWERRDVLFKVVYGDSISDVVANNIRTFSTVSEPEDIYDDVRALMYLLTHKKITVNLEEKIDYPALLIEYKDKVGELYGILRSEERKNWRRNNSSI